MNIGERIKEARKHRKLSQAALADQLGVAQPSVSEWERGLSDPTMDNLAMAATVLRVSIEWLGTGEGEMEQSADHREIRAAETGSREDQMLLLFRDLNWIQQGALIEFLKKWK